ncbi:MAG: hypothetical protein PHP98_07855 [Kiritimatiellae bacterium]|jgi:hypothetical protein|nr:hypothetical protein [Kiritimatiellia bacterium]
MKKIFPALAFALLIGGPGIAADGEQPVSAQFKVKAVSLAVKAGLKAYMAKADFPSLKSGKITEINRMSAPQFAAEYDRAWRVLEKCPVLVAKYNLRPNMAKPEVLKIMGRLTRDECLEAVDSIPDAVIVEQLTGCLNGPEMQDKPYTERINILMEKVFTRNGG